MRMRYQWLIDIYSCFPILRFVWDLRKAQLKTLIRMGFWKRLTEFLWGSDIYFQKTIPPHSTTTFHRVPVLDAFDITSIDGSCNSAKNRQCWSKGFDINTDYEIDRPKGIARRASTKCGWGEFIPLTDFAVHFGFDKWNHRSRWVQSRAYAVQQNIPGSNPRRQLGRHIR